MTTSETTALLAQGGLTRPPTGRPVVYATQGVISSGHYLTSMAGMRMLLDGGNAFDAVVAAGFAAAVVEPDASYTLASEGVFMLYHAASGKLLSLSGQGTAPGRATIDFYTSQGLDAIPTGPGPLAPLAFTVPGVVDALMSLLDRYGTKTLGEVLAPSISYAERGIPNYEYMIQGLGAETTMQQFDQYPPGGKDVFFNDGELPKPGTLLVQKSLANTLKKMVEAGQWAQCLDVSSAPSRGGPFPLRPIIKHGLTKSRISATWKSCRWMLAATQAPSAPTPPNSPRSPSPSRSTCPTSSCGPSFRASGSASPSSMGSSAGTRVRGGRWWSSCTRSPLI